MKGYTTKDWKNQFDSIEYCNGEIIIPIIFKTKKGATEYHKQNHNLKPNLVKVEITIDEIS